MRTVSICACLPLLLAVVSIACLEDPTPYTMRVTGVVDNHTTAERIPGAVVHVSAGHMGMTTGLFGGGPYSEFRSVASGEKKSKSDGHFDVSVSASDGFVSAHLSVRAPGYLTYEVDLPRQESMVIAVSLEPIPTP